MNSGNSSFIRTIIAKIRRFGHFAPLAKSGGENIYPAEIERSKTAGLMLAYDAPVGEQTRAGVTAGFANSRVDGNNASGNAKIDSYQLTAYLGHVVGPWFAQGALSFGVDQYKGSRDIAFPGVNRSANVDYSGRQYTALLAPGKHLYMGETIVTPLVSLAVSRLQVGGYTESGAGDLNLQVEKQNYDIVRSSLGVKAERVIQTTGGAFSPEVHVKWEHDFNGNTMRQDASFTGGGAGFTTQGVNGGRDLYKVGAGVTILSCNCERKSWTVKGLYDYKWTQNHYASHQLSLITGIRF